MKTIKVIITPLSSFASDIQSDTLFGAFCWNYLDKYGEIELKKLLDNHAIVFSNIFPFGKLPCPILPNIGNDYEKIEDYRQLKKLKKIKHLPSEFFKEELNSAVLASMKADYANKKEKKEEISKSQIIIRSSIDRNTGTVLESALFSDIETFYKKDTKLMFYVMFDEQTISEEKIKDTIQLLSVFGIGKDKSTGKGAFTVEYVENDLPQSTNKKYFMTLSNGLPDGDCELVYGKTITKFSKVARGSMFRKNPIQMYTEGSIFKVKNVKDFYGAYNKDVFDKNNSEHEGYVHHACLFPLFIDLGLGE